MLGPKVAQQLEIVSPARALDPAVATELLQAYYNLNRPLILSLSACQERVNLTVVPRPHDLELVERATRGVSPLLDITRSEIPPPSTGQIHLTCAFGQGGRLAVAPLKRVDEFKRSDPLHAILEQVMPLQADEVFTFYLFIRPISAERGEEAEGELWGRLNPLLALLLQLPREYPRFPPELHKIFEERLYTDYLFEGLGILSLRGTNRARLWSRTRSLSAILPNKLYAGFSGLQLGEWTRASNAITKPETKWLIISAAELASLWHPISQDVQVPGVVFIRHQAPNLPPALLRASEITLGTTRYRGQTVPIGLAFDDFHAGHLVIPSGATGTGKSTFLANISHSLITQQPKSSLLGIDPHGTLAVQIASQAIPDARIEDTYLFELGDSRYPYGLPVFQRPAGVSLDDYIRVTFEMFKVLFAAQWSASRMADTFHSVTATLCYQPKASLQDVEKLFTNSAFRRRALGRVDDPVTISWWQRFEAQSAAAQREWAAPILSRLGALYRDKPVRNMLCQSGGVDWGELMNEGKICLISFAGAPEQDLLGEYIISRLHLEFLSRLARANESHRRTYLMIDESQRYRGPSLPVLLAEARKVSATLLLATQVIKRWSDALAEAVLGNVGTIACFQTGVADSTLLARLMKPFTADDLENLNRYECFVKMKLGGNTMPALHLKTLPLEPVRDESSQQQVLMQIRQQTRQRFARPRAEVEASFRRFDQPPADDQEREDIEEE